MSAGQDENILIYFLRFVKLVFPRGGNQEKSCEESLLVDFMKRAVSEPRLGAGLPWHAKNPNCMPASQVKINQPTLKTMAAPVSPAAQPAHRP